MARGDRGGGPLGPAGAHEPPPTPRRLGGAAGDGHDESAELGHFLADGSPEAAPEESVLEGIEDDRTRSALLGALSSLSPTERAIVVRRYGLYGHEPRKLQEIAEELSLSRERVRQLQRRAEDKVRRALTDGS